MKIKIGETGTYIQDYDFHYLFKMPKEAALALVQTCCPEAVMGTHTLAKDLTLENMVKAGWTNKLFVIIGIKDKNKQFAIANKDGSFILYEGKVDDV